MNNSQGDNKEWFKEIKQWPVKLKQQWDKFKQVEEEKNYQEPKFSDQDKQRVVPLAISEDAVWGRSPKINRNKRSKKKTKKNNEVVLRIDNDMEQLKWLKKFK